jgi:hypothetical protein
VTVVADAKVSLLEGAELGIELQNTWLVVVEELSLDREPRMTCVLHGLPNNLVELGERVPRIEVTMMLSSLAQ